SCRSACVVVRPRPDAFPTRRSSGLQPAAHIERCVRAFNPWPVSYFTLGEHNIKLWQSKVLDEASELAPGTVIRATKTGIDVATGDRKSTRLNSSHVSISYAVSCLKI